MMVHIVDEDVLHHASQYPNERYRRGSSPRPREHSGSHNQEVALLRHNVSKSSKPTKDTQPPGATQPLELDEELQSDASTETRVLVRSSKKGWVPEVAESRLTSPSSTIRIGNSRIEKMSSAKPSSPGKRALSRQEQRNQPKRPARRDVYSGPEDEDEAAEADAQKAWMSKLLLRCKKVPVPGHPKQWTYFCCIEGCDRHYDNRGNDEEKRWRTLSGPRKHMKARHPYRPGGSLTPLTTDTMTSTFISDSDSDEDTAVELPLVAPASRGPSLSIPIPPTQRTESSFIRGGGSLSTPPGTPGPLSKDSPALTANIEIQTNNGRDAPDLETPAIATIDVDTSSTVAEGAWNNESGEDLGTSANVAEDGYTKTINDLKAADVC
jgi:hypothetical protein